MDAHTENKTTAYANDILAITDRCVKCAMCAPHCPTYQLSTQEAESPRGRIALAEGLAKGALPLTDKVIEHLDNCLHCGACEKACPANVPYKQLIHKTLAFIHTQRKKPKIPRVLNTLLHHPRWIRGLGRLIVLYQKIGLHRVWQRLGLFKQSKLSHMLQLLPPSPLTKVQYKKSKQAKKVILWQPCLSPLFEGALLSSARTVLRACGYEPIIFHRCCGALHQQAGLPYPHEKLNNTLRSLGDHPLLTLASGCETQINTLHSSTELCDFIIKNNLLEKLSLKPLALTASLHTPCTANNNHAIMQLLAAIPELHVKPLASQQCCGAGGLNLVHDKSTQALVKPLMNEKSCDILITYNIGCRTQFTRYANQCPNKLKIYHPIELIAAQIVTN